MSTDWTEDTSLSGEEIEVLRALDFASETFRDAAKAPNDSAQDDGPGHRPPTARRPSRLAVVWGIAALLLLAAGWRSLLPVIVAVGVYVTIKLVVAATTDARDTTPRR